ncbi:MAG: nucleoside deaminase [Bacteriovoracaceae bacterium]|jgi:tRNA(adenine34) deaminase|nr:nucleoside deaminase [Bacteriovoracaceae bacterium]
MNLNISTLNIFMDEAILLAKEAAYYDEVPVGAIIIDSNNNIVSRGYNKKEKRYDVTAHAEIFAIKELAKDIQSWRLNDYKMIVTLEPCPMCFSAISQSRLSEVYFGAYDKKGGALSLGYNLHQDSRLNHNFSAYGGIKHFETAKLLSDYFKLKRKQRK